jgi:putative nucleotidyltransferase with HDIG domain
MIPTIDQAKQLWDTYQLPQAKRLHVTLVAKVAVFLARKLIEEHTEIQINIPLLESAALLHDIDKAIPKLEGEQHPDAGVRVLREQGLSEVATLVATHPVHMLLSPDNGPKSWEEKLLFLADKMVKYEVLTVDKRFELWLAEPLPEAVKKELRLIYPQVKQLENEVFNLIHLDPVDLVKLV